jgi:hypothetical protein
VSLDALASPSELGTYLGVVIDAEDARALLLLRAASGLVRDAAGQTWDGSGDVVPDTAWSVTLACAARAWENPTAKTDQAEGPFRDGWDSGAAGLVLLEHETATLGRLRDGAGPLSVLSFTRGPLETPAVVDDYALDSVEERAPWELM